MARYRCSECGRERSKGSTIEDMPDMGQSTRDLYCTKCGDTTKHHRLDDGFEVEV